MIYLHIGRNKAGSTTLQDFCIERHEALLAAGLRYLQFGHLANSHGSVLGFSTAPDLAAFVRHTGARVLVSNEFMSAWDDVYTAAVAEALTGLDVQVLFYIRDYGDWLPSLYAESVKRGDEILDFDAYAQTMASRVSVRPMLTAWAEAVGWTRIRVRALDPRALFGGDIVSDALNAMDLSTDLTQGWAQRSNRSPGWMSLELIRAARSILSDPEWMQSAETVQMLADAMPPSVSPAQPEAGYLSVDQAGALADLYDSDTRWIFGQTGEPSPLARRHPGRQAVDPPSWRTIPDSAIEQWRLNVSSGANALADRLLATRTV